MKKVKLMLLSLSVLAVVGGALAFTAKGTTRFCTAAVNGSSPFCNKACPNDNAKLLADNDLGSFICTTTTSGNASTPCQSGGVDLQCTTNSAKYIIEP